MMTSSNGNIFRITGHLRGIHQSPVNSPHKGREWRRALIFSLICAWMNDCFNQWWGWRFEMPLHSLWCHIMNILSRIQPVSIILSLQVYPVHYSNITECYAISNHQQIWLFKSLFKATGKKTFTFHITGLLRGESTGKHDEVLYWTGI